MDSETDPTATDRAGATEERAGTTEEADRTLVNPGKGADSRNNKRKKRRARMKFAKYIGGALMVLLVVAFALPRISAYDKN